MQTKLKPNSGRELLCGVCGEGCFGEGWWARFAGPGTEKNNA